MSLLQAEETIAEAQTSNGDQAAVSQLHQAFQTQQKAFTKDKNPSLTVRRERLERLSAMMVENRAGIYAALKADFGAHPDPAAEVLEVHAVTARVDYALANLEQWMQPKAREVDAPYASVLRAFVQSQPKGVVGNIAPWNFPFEIGIGPMVDMLAAGNRVMLKPSEFAPASAALMKEMLAATFPADLVYVAVGGLDLAKAFSALPFDHLMYTGSSDVGRQVMLAAAENLTPVTLELGGKCPAVLLPGSVTAENVGGILGVKMIKNGQMCVSVDHCFVPRAEAETFAELAVGFMEQAAPDYASSGACTGIISDRHLHRLSAMLEDAEVEGARIVPLEKSGKIDPTSRAMPISLVLNPGPKSRIMREEIFGPILPVIAYDDVAEVIEQINQSEHPLGVYVYGEDIAAAADVLAQTTSGGGAINACAIQAGLKSLGFGGVGVSGMGRHHGEDGFREFSNQRGMVVRGEGANFDVLVAQQLNPAELAGQVPSG